MDRLREIIENTWGICIFISIGYSFLVGLFMPEISKRLRFGSLSKYPIVNVIRIISWFPVLMFISIIPGLALSRIYHPDYGMSSFLFFLIGMGVRRILHETKIWRGPPWF
jgi:hypothetical protein